MEKRLLIFNGDHAWQCWEKTVEKKEIPFLVWRENFLEGPLPAGVSHSRFERARAAFLHSCVPEYTEENLYRFLMGLHTALEDHSTSECEIILYFDCCMYDMIMLARILWLLKDSGARIRLFCEDVILGCAPEVFRREYASLRELSDEDKRVYAHAWECVLQGAEAVARFNRERYAQNEPFLEFAMARYGEDHPCDGSMGRSQRQLLEIIRSGVSSFPEIFRSFDRYEKYMFMGDTFCMRLLEDMVRKALISKKEPGPGEKYPAFFPLPGSLEG